MKKAETGAVNPTLTPVNLQVRMSSLLIFVWVTTLLVSNLPDILLSQLNISMPISVVWIKIALLLVFIALGFFWELAKSSRTYFTMFLVLYLVNALFDYIGTTFHWESSFTSSISFGANMFGNQLLRMSVASMIIFVLWVIYSSPSDYFFAKGDLNAVAEQVRWLGINRPTHWIRFGLILALCITLGTLAFLVISGHPSLSIVTQIVPLMPVIFLLSAMNAFSEEMTYRAALLAPLHRIIDRSNALLLTAVLFGLWHFNGVPYGILGVIMAGGLGWLLGKSMLETKGLFWAWFIHFWQDVVIFAFIAAGSVIPGG